MPFEKLFTVLFRWSRTRTPAQWTSSTGRQWVHLHLLPHAKKTLVRLHRGAFPQLWRLQGSITGAAAQAEVTLCTRRPPMGTKAIGATLNTRYTDSFFCMFPSLRRQPPCLGREASLATSPPPLSRALLDISWQPVMQPVGTWGIKVAM